MGTHAEKAQENKGQSVVKEVSYGENKGTSSFQFTDNRPEAIQLQEMQHMMNNTWRVQQLKVFQEMASNSPLTKQRNDVVQRMLVPGVLNVVGEDHEESGKENRREEEKAFCRHKVGGHYWKEDEFPASLDAKDEKADSVLLLIKFTLASIQEGNNELIGKDAKRDNTSSDTKRRWVPIRETLEALYDEYLILLKYEKNGDLEAKEWMKLNKAKIDALEAAYNRGLMEHVNPSAEAKAILDTMGISSVEDASKARAVAMDAAARKQTTRTGVWKIGDIHIGEIKQIWIDQKEAKDPYVINTRQEFNDEYNFVPPPPDDEPALPAKEGNNISGAPVT